MNTIPEFVKQGFLQEYRCIYSGFEDDLDKIKGKENKIDFFKQEFSTSRYGCYEANKNLMTALLEDLFFHNQGYQQ